MGGGAFLMGGGIVDNQSGQPINWNTAAIFAPGAATLTGNNQSFEFSGSMTSAGGANLPATLTMMGGVTNLSGIMNFTATQENFVKDGPGQLVFSGSANIAGQLNQMGGTTTITGFLKTGNNNTLDVIGSVQGVNAVLDVNGGTLVSGRTGLSPSFTVGNAANSSFMSIHNNGTNQALVVLSGQLGVANGKRGLGC